MSPRFGPSFADLPGRLSAAGRPLLRAMPRGADHALLVLDGPDGDTPAQWFASPDRARQVARQTVSAAPSADVVQLLPDVVVQPDGADRRLTHLARLVAEPGVRLRAHRPERRAVVERPGPDGAEFVKLVRPGRLTPELVAATSLRIDGVPTPRVIAVDDATSSLTTAGLPGPTLHERLGTDAVTADDLVEVGALLARLHHADVPSGTAAHGPAEEIAVVDRWLGLVDDLGLAPHLPECTTAARRALPALLPESTGLSLLHRDLHDKQVVLDPAGAAMLDLDLLAVGDPALDLANLVVHLELRANQGLLTRTAAQALIEALLTGYRPDAATAAAVDGYLLASRLRLAAVYSFRPPSRDAAHRLLTHPLVPTLP